MTEAWTHEDAAAVMREDASSESVRAAQTAFPAAARRHQPFRARPYVNQSRYNQSESCSPFMPCLSKWLFTDVIQVLMYPLLFPLPMIRFPVLSITRTLLFYIFWEFLQ